MLARESECFLCQLARAGCRSRYLRVAVLLPQAGRLDDELLIAVTGEMTSESTLAAHFTVRRGGEPLETAVISYVAVRDGHRCQLSNGLRDR